MFDAAPSICHIHHRMPVVLKPEHYARWMSAQASEPDVALMTADARQDFEGHAVSVRVNSVRNDGHDLIERLLRDDLFG